MDSVTENLRPVRLRRCRPSYVFGGPVVTWYSLDGAGSQAPLIDKGICPHYGEIRSRHPLPMSKATGAARTQLEPALALAITLIKQIGLTARAARRVLEHFTGLRLIGEGLVQTLDRSTDKSFPQYPQ